MNFVVLIKNVHCMSVWLLHIKKCTVFFQNSKCVPYLYVDFSFILDGVLLLLLVNVKKYKSTIKNDIFTKVHLYYICFQIIKFTTVNRVCLVLF